MTVLLLFQLLLATFGVYAALKYSGMATLFVPLGCLVAMFFIGKLERRLKGKEVGEESAHKEHDGSEERRDGFDTVKYILWGKNELMLVDAVHSVLRDLGLQVTKAPEYRTIDRIIKIPGSHMTFGMQVIGSEREVRGDNSKLTQALQFEQEKKNSEKTVIIANAHHSISLAERDKREDFSKEAIMRMEPTKVVGLNTFTLYKVWALCKYRGKDVKDILKLLFNHPGGMFRVEDYNIQL
jgi:Na+-transporting methylmalonyl-CoA/oxaloacetate decarboxylase gamma subunit